MYRIQAHASIILLLLVLAFPVLLNAQATSEDALHATIRAQVLSDPRTSSLTPEQLNAMVDSLATEAAARGLRASDLEWHPLPASASEGSSADACGSTPAFLCAMNRAIGLDGSDTRLGSLLAALAIALLLGLGAYLEIKHRRGAIALQVAN